MLGCVGMSDGVGGECHRQTPPWLQHQRHNHPKRGDLTKPQTNQCQALIADTWVDRHVQIVLSKFSDFPKGLAGRLVKGLFTYYSSQNQGFLDPLRQQWSAFGLGNTSHKKIDFFRALPEKGGREGLARIF